MYGLRHGRDGRAADLALTSVCLGLLAGVKYYAAGYAALAWLASAMAATIRRGVGRGVVTAGVTALAVLPWGGYWYARNVWATGPPFFSKGFTPGDLPHRWHTELMHHVTWWTKKILVSPPTAGRAAPPSTTA